MGTLEAGMTSLMLEPTSPKSVFSTDDTWSTKASESWECLERRAWYMSLQESWSCLSRSRILVILTFPAWEGTPLGSSPRGTKMDAVTSKDIKSKKQFTKDPLPLAASAGPGQHRLSCYRSIFKSATLEFIQSCSYPTKRSSVPGNSKSHKTICSWFKVNKPNEN